MPTVDRARARRAAAAVLALAGVAVIAGSESAAQGVSAARRTSICHRTPAGKRPYSKVLVSPAQLNIHLGHPSDVIPAPQRGCPTVVLSPTRGGVTLRAGLSGSSEPSGDPDGEGTTILHLRTGEGRVCFRTAVVGIGLPAFASHIHYGPAGSTGPVVVPLGAPDETGTAAGCVPVGRKLVAGLLAQPGSFYVNVHNAEYEESAVRGQLE